MPSRAAQCECGPAALRRAAWATFAEWMSVLTKICRHAGLSAAIARRRAEDAIVRIEGALVVAAGMGDRSVFGRTLDELRATLLVP